MKKRQLETFQKAKDFVFDINLLYFVYALLVPVSAFFSNSDQKSLLFFFAVVVQFFYLCISVQDLFLILQDEIFIY